MLSSRHVSRCRLARARRCRRQHRRRRRPRGSDGKRPTAGIFQCLQFHLKCHDPRIILVKRPLGAQQDFRGHKIVASQTCANRIENLRNICVRLVLCGNPAPRQCCRRRTVRRVSRRSVTMAKADLLRELLAHVRPQQKRRYRKRADQQASQNRYLWMNNRVRDHGFGSVKPV